MKVYRLGITDNVSGRSLYWFSSRAAAQAFEAGERRERRKQSNENREADGLDQLPDSAVDFESDIELVDVPTRKADLIRWLNIYCNADNG